MSLGDNIADETPMDRRQRLLDDAQDDLEKKWLDLHRALARVGKGEKFAHMRAMACAGRLAESLAIVKRRKQLIQLSVAGDGSALDVRMESPTD